MQLQPALSIVLTEQQYLNCKLDWCSKDGWEALCKYWTSDKYKDERRAAQEARLKSDDVAQNRGGSRPWGETQQLLEHKFGPEKAGTLNTYAVMKSGFKNVDSSGKSAPIPSQKAQRRLDDYNARAMLDENSKELNELTLYHMEGGLPHGRVPIADGAVDKDKVIAAAKSNNLRPTNTAAYHIVVEENDQLKKINRKLMQTSKVLLQTNNQLKETNEIVIDENGVNRDLILRFYADFNKPVPADLLNRLANIDARRHQVTASSHAGTMLDDLLRNGNDINNEDDEDYIMDDHDGYHSDDESDDTYSDNEDGGSEEVDMDEDHVNTN